MFKNKCSYPIIDGSKYHRIVFVSDIHGYYASFVEMRNTIALSKGDLLVVCGDVFDRGPESVEVWKDLSKNHDYDTIVLLGNHEQMLFEYLFIEKRIFRHAEYFYDTTNEQLKKCSKSEIHTLIKWIRKLPHYIEISTPNTTFAVAHACTLHPEDETFCIIGDDNIDNFYTGSGIPGKISICGHYPTSFIRSIVGEPLPCSNEIYINAAKSVYGIDCSNGYRYEDGKSSGCLGVLCYNVGSDRFEIAYV